METKRCQRCHKLLRAEAQMCSRCGARDFLRGKQAGSKHTGSLASKEVVSMSPDPLPSPHRAGHYSGLHPEDQPYQSSFLPAQHSPVSARPTFEVEEVEEDEALPYTALPGVSSASTTSAPVAVPTRRVASLSPLPQPRQQRSVAFQTEIEQDETERDLAAASLPTPVPVTTDPRPPNRRKQGRLVPILLLTSCLLFVTATSILGYLVLGGKSAPTLNPRLFVEPTDALRVHDLLLLSGSGFEANSMITITRDGNIPVFDDSGNHVQGHSYSTGDFSVEFRIPESWAGVSHHTIIATDQQNHSKSTIITIQNTPNTPPLLQLGSTHIDLGANSADVVSHQIITLENGGGGLLSWQGSIAGAQSTQSGASTSWLTLNPSNGTFAGKAFTTITVNRKNLAPQSYTGTISFTQQDSNARPLTLKVTMAVNPASANLVLSYSAINFQGTTAQNPAAQPITVRNTSNQVLDWTATVAAANQGNWLALSSYSGNLAAGSQTTLLVSGASIGLSPGTYQGALTFSYSGAAATPVAVTLTVAPPPLPKLSLQSSSLTFKAIQGQNPAAQSFTIRNIGNAPLNWSIVEDSNGVSYVPVSQTHGTIAPSKTTVVSVGLSITKVSAGTLNALITVVDNDAGAPVKSQQIKVTINIVNQAVISLSQNQFDFNSSSAIPNSTQLLIITNTGSASLNWSLSISNASSVQWLTVDNSGGTLEPGGVDLVNITSDSTNLAVGSYTATLTVQDTDQNSPVLSQAVTVTLNVSS